MQEDISEQNVSKSDCNPLCQLPVNGCAHLFKLFYFVCTVGVPNVSLIGGQ